MARHQSSQAAGSHIEQPQRDPHIVGGADQLGRSSRPGLPASNERITTKELGAILFSHTKFPEQAAWRWLTNWQIPTDRVGRTIRVSGASIAEGIKRQTQQARRRRIKAAS